MNKYNFFGILSKITRTKIIANIASKIIVIILLWDKFIAYEPKIAIKGIKQRNKNTGESIICVSIKLGLLKSLSLK